MPPAAPAPLENEAQLPEETPEAEVVTVAESTGPADDFELAEEVPAAEELRPAEEVPAVEDIAGTEEATVADDVQAADEPVIAVDVQVADEPVVADGVAVSEEAGAIVTAAPVWLEPADVPAPPGSIREVGPITRVASARIAPSRSAQVTSQPALLAITGLVVLVGAVLALGGRPGEVGVAGFTDAPTRTSPVVIGGVPSPTPTAVPAPSATFLLQTIAPTLTQAPKPAPAATARPTPRPTPTPIRYCKVPKLIGLESNRAKGTWSNAGFTGQVTFSPAIPPHYTITSQSRTAGTSVRCTSGITVSGTP